MSAKAAAGPRRGSGCLRPPTSCSTTRACTPSALTGSSSAPGWRRRRCTTPSAARTSWSAPTWRARHARVAARITSYLERYSTPRERLLGVFEAQGEIFADSGFRGCAFVAASAESPGEAVSRAADDYRGWVRGLLTGLAREAGAPDPETLGRQLHMIYDGASLSARMDRDPSSSVAARAAAGTLLDAALA